MKKWLKWGIIGAIIGLIWWLVGIISVGFIMHESPFYKGWILLISLFSNILEFFIIGAIMGFIVDKVKSKEENFNIQKKRQGWPAWIKAGIITSIVAIIYFSFFKLMSLFVEKGCRNTFGVPGIRAASCNLIAVLGFMLIAVGIIITLVLLIIWTTKKLDNKE